MSKLEFYLNKIVHYGLYAILLTPLVFWPRALFGFMTPKFILFQVLVEIVFAAWLILLVYRSGLTQIWADLRRNYIILALSGFIAVSFISAAFGVDFSRSFWGIGARMTGLFAEIHFFTWFLVLVSTFRSGSTQIEADKRGNGTYQRESAENPHISASTYLNFSFVVALLVAISAFYENTAWRLVYGSTFFNNPTFVGPYFIFHFFWGLYQLFRSGSTQIEADQRGNRNYPHESARNPHISASIKRWFFGAGTALLVFVIFLGQVRGVMLGIFVGLFVFGLGIIFANVVGRRLKILILAFFALIFIGLAGIWFVRESAFVKNASILKRLTQISLSQTTVQTRFFAWRAAFQGFKERPLLGVGPENFNFVFNAHYNPSLLKYGLGETWFDKPHNAFLEILTENGIIGSLAYLLILMVVAFALFKLFKSGLPADRQGQKILALALASAFTAYLSSMFFSFDSFGSWFGLFLFLAFLASQNRDTNIQIHANYTNKRILSILVSLVFISILASVYINYNILRANVADADALRVFSSNPAQGIELFKKSLSYKTPYKAEYQFDLFASVAGAISKNVPLPNLEQNINLVLEEGETAVVAHPNNAAYYTDLVKLYNILAEKGRDPQIIGWAETYGEKSLELSPNRQETLYYLARTALLKGDTKHAVTLTKNAIDAEPSINASHWYFGLALIADNQGVAGKTEIKKSLELGYQPQNETERNFVKQLGL